MCRTRVKTPGQNGSRERGLGSLKYEKLFLEEIPDVLDLVAHAEDYGSSTTPCARTRCWPGTAQRRPSGPG
jgi:hypothetical protein